jgi:hypothetical protein
MVKVTEKALEGSTIVEARDRWEIKTMKVEGEGKEGRVESKGETEVTVDLVRNSSVNGCGIRS